ncbi:MAG: LapA family protein [Gammaproteobacteria bacterium]|nr:LapA family protein [Gammaproteobacteria bacterium]MDD9823306.1 LapA family protein [Gammaproteobacteria bacterium]MDD9884349.1 LapA family protein [Gammaproteobacteria bacterium]
MRKFIYVLFVAVVALFGLTFSFRNHQRIGIDYYFGVDFEVQLPLLLFVTFALGLLVGCLATLPRVFGARRQLNKARRESRALARRGGDSS